MASAPTPPPESNPPVTTVIESDLKLHAVPPDSAEGAVTLTCDDVAPLKPGAAPNAPAPPGYELLAELGRGGMGVVYKARQQSLNRVVALKVVLAGGHASASQRLRFLAEAEAVAALNHVGIVGVYEFGTWGDQPYMALEFCAGGTLADRLRGTPLKPREAAMLVERLGLAVEAAHERGIVHRDIKPANVLIAADGTPKIGDFGLAKMTETEGITATGAVLGTPSYMAPEQARGDAKTVGPAADVYALGALFYECLTGRPPFRGASPADTIVQSLSQEPVGVRALNPAVPVDLETVCLKCLEKDPVRRYPSARALADDLLRFLDGRPVLARPVGALGRARRWVARNQIVAGLLGAVAFTIVAGTTTTYVKYLDEARQRATAEDEARKKEAALTTLRETLGKLEALTEQQARTLEQLRAEKAATEDALLRGLMRPFRNHADTALLLEEARALADLTGLPEERLRFRFVSRGLESPDGADKIAAWPQEVTGAVVGLDHAAAGRLRDTVLAVLKNPTASRNAHVASAFLIGALPGGDSEADQLAARVLAEQLATRPAAALGDLSAGMQLLLPRLPPAAVAPLARPVVERLAAERTPGLSAPTGAAVSALAAALAPGDAEALAGTLAKSLVERIPTEQDTNAIASCTAALAALTRRLAADREHAVLAPVVRALAARCAGEKDSTPVGHLARSLAGLAVLASPADRSAAAKVLAARAEAEKDPITLADLAGGFAVATSGLPAAEAATLVRPLLTRLATETDSGARNYLAPPVGDILSRLPREQAAALVRSPGLALAEKLAAGKGAQAVAEFSATFTPIARHLAPADAATAAGLFVDRIKAEKDANALDALSTCLGGVCKTLPATSAGALAKVLLERTSSEKDGTALSRLAAAATYLAGCQSPADGEALTARVVASVVSHLLAEKDADAAQVHAATLDKLAAGLCAADAAAAGKALAGRLATEQDAALCSALALALSAVAARLPADDEAALVAGPTRKLADHLASAREFASVNSAVKAINVLAPQLSPADAAAVLKLIVDRTVGEREHAWHYLVDGLWDTAARQLAPADAAAFARALVARLEVEKDPVVTKSLCHLLAVVAVRLDADDAVASAGTLAQRAVAEKDPSLQLAFGQSFAAHTHQLGDADLLALLKSHAAFPQVRLPVLAEFGRRAGRTRAAAAVAGPIAPAATSAPPFATVWDFRAWARQAHPDLDAQAAPPAGAGG